MPLFFYSSLMKPLQTRFLTCGKFSFVRRCSYVGNVKRLQELKENNDKCKQFLERGRFLVYYKGRPLLKADQKHSSRLEIVEFDFADLLKHFEDSDTLLGNAVLLQLDQDSIARCAVSVPPKLESVADKLDKEAGGTFFDMRAAMFLLPAKHSFIVAQGAGLLNWHRHFKFCNRCGKEALRNTAGSHIQCPSCNQLYYPQLSPVAISAVTSPAYDRCLLVRQQRHPPGMFTTIAGYVEVGERLEDAVRREIAEEVGLEISRQEYLRSQHWPLPMSTLMMGCLAVANPDAKIDLDTQELEDARWFSKAEVAQAVKLIEENPLLRVSRSDSGPMLLVPPEGAVAHDLIKYWLNKA